MYCSVAVPAEGAIRKPRLYLKCGRFMQKRQIHSILSTNFPFFLQHDCCIHVSKPLESFQILFLKNSATRKTLRCIMRFLEETADSQSSFPAPCAVTFHRI